MTSSFCFSQTPLPIASCVCQSSCHLQLKNAAQVCLEKNHLYAGRLLAGYKVMQRSKLQDAARCRLHLGPCFACKLRSRKSKFRNAKTSPPQCACILWFLIHAMADPSLEEGKGISRHDFVSGTTLSQKRLANGNPSDYNPSPQQKLPPGDADVSFWTFSASCIVIFARSQAHNRSLHTICMCELFCF